MSIVTLSLCFMPLTFHSKILLAQITTSFLCKTMVKNVQEFDEYNNNITFNITNVRLDVLKKYES